MNISKSDILYKYSNPQIVEQKAKKYFNNNNVKILKSTRKDKKYMILDPNNKYVHFGSMNPPMADFTKHNDKERQKAYLARATHIKGNWGNNKYSPNNLSINLLW